VSSWLQFAFVVNSNCHLHLPLPTLRETSNNSPQEENLVYVVSIWLWFLLQVLLMMMCTIVWNANLTLISWNQFPNIKPLDHMVLVLIVFTMSFYLVININSLHMFKKFIHHNFGLDNPYYNFYSIFLFKIKEKLLCANFHCVHGSFICQKKNSMKIITCESNFFSCQVNFQCKQFLNARSFLMKECFWTCIVSKYK